MTPTLSTDATVILAVLAAIGVIVAAAAWFYRRGGQESGIAVALQDNTAATRELSAEFRKFRDEVIDKLHGLDIRVTRLEVTPPPIQVTTKVEAPSNDSASAHRNPSPQGGHQTG